jgi:rhodanese-related sulfurtransferase
MNSHKNVNMELLKKYIIIILSLFFFSCNAQNKQVLSVDEFEKGMLKDSAQILDVRTVGEYNSGHLENALWADWNNEKEFDRRSAFIDKKRPVYVYCLSGGRSASAANKMRKQGYNVYELKGGINAWKAGNKNIAGKSNEKQMTIDEYNIGIASNTTVLVDFGATWCPPCKAMEPIVQNLQKKYAEKFTLLKVDGGKDEVLLKKYNVTALPVFIVYKNGKEVWRKDGVATEKELDMVLK